MLKILPLLATIIILSCHNAGKPEADNSSWGDQPGSASVGLYLAPEVVPLVLGSSDTLFLELSSPGVDTIRTILTKGMYFPTFRLLAMRPWEATGLLHSNNGLRVGSATVFVIPPELVQKKQNFRIQMFLLGQPKTSSIKYQGK